MPFLPTKPFVPVVTPVPILGPSSGNPESLKDPKSLGSIGGKLQAMTDQARADTLYDAIPSGTKESFTNLTTPWIVGSPACKKEGFTGSLGNGYRFDLVTASCFLLGLTLVVSSYCMR